MSAGVIRLVGPRAAVLAFKTALRARKIIKMAKDLRKKLNVDSRGPALYHLHLPR